MIFMVWFILWVFAATSAWMLCVPILCLVARSSYLKRRWLPGWFSLIMGVCVYLMVDFSMPTYVAVMYGLRVVLTIQLIGHYVSAIGGTFDQPSGVPGHVTKFVHVLVRSVRLLPERIAEVTHATRIRQSMHSGSWRFFWAIWEDIKSTFVVLNELVELVKGFDDSITARGGFPHPKQWKTPARLFDILYIGDVAIVILTTLIAINISLPLVPTWLCGVVESLNKAFGV